MKRFLLGALTGLALSITTFSMTAAIAADDQSAESTRGERMQRWAAATKR